MEYECGPGFGYDIARFGFKGQRGSWIGGRPFPACHYETLYSYRPSFVTQGRRHDESNSDYMKIAELVCGAASAPRRGYGEWLLACGLS